MAIYGIADLHLSFGVDKPMNVFGKCWEGYEEKLKKNWNKVVKEQDTVIIAGDISWATYLSEAKPDFDYIHELNGKKIILRGNHDYYFETKTKQDNFFKDNEFTSLSMLYNNCFDTPEYIICGARGWGDTEDKQKNDDKIMAREIGRLILSLEQGCKMKQEYLNRGIQKDILVALHFPPFEKGFMDVLKKYQVKKCIYGHLHGFGHSKVKEGIIEGIEFCMVACDYTKFKLVQL